MTRAVAVTRWIGRKAVVEANEVVMNAVSTRRAVISTRAALHVEVTNGDFMEPPILSGYTVHELIGRGGRADVWRVCDQQGQVFAAKVEREVTPTGSRREWRLLAGLRHPNLVAVHDFCLLADGRGAVIMPLFEGGSLETLVHQRGALTIGEAITALVPVSEALAMLHSNGLFHGDISPTNVLLDGAGKPFLSDVSECGVLARATVREWGSDGYLAPEVLAGEPADHAADVFALGALLSFLMTGSPLPGGPILGASDLESEWQGPLRHLIHECLSAVPQQRPAAAAFAQGLRALGIPCPIEVAKVPPSPSSSQMLAKNMTQSLAREHAIRSLTRRISPTLQVPRAEGAPKTKASIIKAWGSSHAPNASGSSNRLRNGGPGPGPMGKKVLVPAVLGVAGVAGVMAVVPSAGARTDSRAALHRGVVAHSAQTAEAARPGADRGRGAGTSGVSTPRHPHASASEDGVSNPIKTIQSLLDCRDRAWNGNDASVLVACFAPGSDGFDAESKELVEAQKAGATYTNVKVRVTRVEAAHPSPKAPPTFRVWLSHSPCQIVTSTGILRVGSSSTEEELELADSPQGWVISRESVTSNH